jgi:BirA family biotin operon repressor/biotin-[acetyl-CoA-carboxylase] ligase
MIAFDVRFHERLDSTQDEARRLAQAGATHATVVTACEQTAGRGRQGRQWASPPGNVYLSVVLRPELPLRRVAELGFVAALAVADVVDALVPGRATLKWPNDVLVDGAKLAGILVEQAGDAVIVGIGLNVLHAPEGAAAPVTSLATLVDHSDKSQFHLRSIEVDEVRVVLLDAFARRLDTWQNTGFESVRINWLLRAHPPGTSLCVNIGSAPIEGRFAGLADDGALLLETVGGLRRILAGNVSMQAP